MTGRVTAIISAYYCKEYLRARIENLLAQDEKPHIIVVAKSGSDEHIMACEFEETEIITTPDIPTIYAAWNIGIEKTTTPYITNANADDIINAGAYKKMADILDAKSTYCLVYPNVDVVDSDGNKQGTFEWMEGGFDALMRGCFIGPMPMWRKSVHKTYELFDDSLQVAGDYDFWLRLAKGGEKFYHIREALGVYLERANSAEHRSPNRSLWEASKVRGRYR